MNSDRKKKTFVQLCVSTKPLNLRCVDLKDDLEAAY